MTWRDRTWISLRHIRSRAVESILVVAATAVGVALVSAMVAFLQGYHVQTDVLLSHPAYRELIVEVVGAETEPAEALVPFEAGTIGETGLGVDQIDAVLEAAPDVSYGYLADTTMFSTGLVGRGAGGARFQGAAPAGTPDASAGDAIVLAPPTAPPEGPAPPAPQPDDARRGALERFDTTQFFADDPDVVTELPLESFGGLEVTEQFFRAYGLSPDSGTLFTAEDLVAGNQVLVLGSELAATLFPGGDAVGTRVRLGFRTFTIVGVLEPTPLAQLDSGVAFDTLAFAPNGGVQAAFGGRMFAIRRPVRTLRFAVEDSAQIGTAANQVQAYFDALYGSGRLRVTAPVDAAAAERDRLGRVLAVVLFLASVALFIASINLFNLMLMRVIRRTREVGIGRALGASRREVFRGFLNESALMSMVGTVIGLAVSPLVHGLLRRSLVSGLPEDGSFGVEYLATGALAAFAISVLFGVWPARQAGRVDASLAIRTE